MTQSTRLIAIRDTQIQIDDDIAIIWAPYEFLMNGVVDHKGTDVFQLVHKDGRWVIAAIACNIRTVEGNKPSIK